MFEIGHKVCVFALISKNVDIFWGLQLQTTLTNKVKDQPQEVGISIYINHKLHEQHF
jgi:hypothetical protein